MFVGKQNYRKIFLAKKPYLCIKAKCQVFKNQILSVPILVYQPLKEKSFLNLSKCCYFIFLCMSGSAYFSPCLILIFLSFQRYANLLKERHLDFYLKRGRLLKYFNLNLWSPKNCKWFECLLIFTLILLMKIQIPPDILFYQYFQSSKSKCREALNQLTLSLYICHALRK